MYAIMRHSNEELLAIFESALGQMQTPEEPEMLEDLLTVAINEAINNAIKTSETEMGAITAGLNMPGLF